MPVLSAYFDRSVNQCELSKPEIIQSIEHTKDGAEIVTYVETDLHELVKSYGVFTDWSLNALMKAGINPDFNIHTSSNTRFEGAEQVNSIDVNSILNDSDFNSVNAE